MNLIEMAAETAKRCKEKREERGLSPGRAVRRRRSQPFRRPEGYGQFARLQRRKPLKGYSLPADLLLVCEPIGSYHFNQIYEFTT